MRDDWFVCLFIFEGFQKIPELFKGFHISKKITFALVLSTTLSLSAILGKAYAALLDGVMSGVEESLASHVAKKGEQLLTGNFYTAEKPNAHGPIGQMGDHTHEKGEFMWSYRYMNMFMKETRQGTNTVSDAVGRGLVGSSISPLSMEMEMHMFGAMYGVNDTLTVMVMVPYLRNGMRMTHSNGTAFTTRSEGLGDIKFGSLWRLWAVEAQSIGAHRFHFNFSVSLPTGDTSPTDRTPLMGGNDNMRLPYPMHLGSGTWDFYPGLTYGGEKGRASWGFQAIGSIRPGKNNNRFQKGNALDLNVHGAYEIVPKWVSSSLRFAYKYWGNYSGADSAITKNVQAAYPEKLGGVRVDVLAGVNFLLPEFAGIETRLAIEGGVPIYQWLRGQLETDSVVTLGWQGVY